MNTPQLLRCGRYIDNRRQQSFEIKCRSPSCLWGPVPWPGRDVIVCVLGHSAGSCTCNADPDLNCQWCLLPWKTADYALALPFAAFQWYQDLGAFSRSWQPARQEKHVLQQLIAEEASFTQLPQLEWDDTWDRGLAIVCVQWVCWRFATFKDMFFPLSVWEGFFSSPNRLARRTCVLIPWSSS